MKKLITLLAIVLCLPTFSFGQVAKKVNEQTLIKIQNRSLTEKLILTAKKECFDSLADWIIRESYIGDHKGGDESRSVALSIWEYSYGQWYYNDDVIETSVSIKPNESIKKYVLQNVGDTQNNGTYYFKVMNVEYEMIHYQDSNTKQQFTKMTCSLPNRRLATTKSIDKQSINIRFPSGDEKDIVAETFLLEFKPVAFMMDENFKVLDQGKSALGSENIRIAEIPNHSWLHSINKKNFIGKFCELSDIYWANTSNIFTKNSCDVGHIIDVNKGIISERALIPKYLINLPPHIRANSESIYF